MNSYWERSLLSLSLANDLQRLERGQNEIRCVPDEGRKLFLSFQITMAPGQILQRLQNDPYHLRCNFRSVQNLLKFFNRFFHKNLKFVRNHNLGLKIAVEIFSIAIDRKKSKILKISRETGQFFFLLKISKRGGVTCMTTFNELANPCH